MFGQVLKLIPRYEFDSFAATHHIGRHSLRDIEANLSAQQGRLCHLGPAELAQSSLTRVNEEQPYTLYEAMFAKLYEACARLAPRHGFRITNRLIRSMSR